MRKRLGLLAFLAASAFSPFQEDKINKTCQMEIKQSDELGSLYKEPTLTRKVYKDLKPGSYIIWVEIPEEKICKPIGIINSGESKFYLQEVISIDQDLYKIPEKYSVKSLE
ncbi:MAG: hypothetical protein WC867_07440 [Candidatus Pacearchaeota archaeon]|jgi:hypothetical protein